MFECDGLGPATVRLDSDAAGAGAGAGSPADRPLVDGVAAPTLGQRLDGAGLDRSDGGRDDLHPGWQSLSSRPQWAGRGNLAIVTLVHTAHGEVSPVGGAAVVGADVVDDVVVEFSEANIIIFALYVV